jgi:hypothetical protein
MKTGIFCLGTRRDARTWEKQCKEVLGFDAPLPIEEASPSLDRLQAFFTRPAEWIYFGGHFLGNELYNEAHDVSARFFADRIDLEVKGVKASVAKASDGFKLAGNVRLIFWGGCSTLGDRELVGHLNQLFGPHVMLGFRRMTGPEMVDAMFIGGKDKFIKKPFFARVSADATNPITCRDAWLNAAVEGYGGAENEDRFAAVDPDGTEWTITDKVVKRGRKLF